MAANVVIAGAAAQRASHGQVIARVALPARFAEPPGPMLRSSTVQILLGLVIGIAIGIWVHGAGSDPDVLAWLNVPSRIFLNLIKCIVAPLIVTMLVVGIAGASDLSSLGRLGLRSFGYFLVGDDARPRDRAGRREPRAAGRGHLVAAGVQRRCARDRREARPG
jgi:hypothetical protein